MPQSKFIVVTCFSLLLNLVIFRFNAAAVAEPQFPCLFIFGDSLVDNGNNNNLNSTAKANYLPYGIDFPAGPTGRFSNGQNMADVIAHLLGLDRSIPPFVNATDEDIVGGVNYASGGAGILDDSGTGFGDVITLSEQLSNHEAAVARLVAYLGSKRATGKHLKSCLYYVGMGSNDYLGNYLPKYYDSSTKYTPTEFAMVAIQQYSKQLRRLYRNGARKVAVVAVGQIGCVPQQLAMYGSNSSTCVQTSNDIAQIFNDKLQRLINRLNYRFPGAKFVYATDVSNNASYGTIKVVDEPCCPVSPETMGHCVEGVTVCSNRDEYYFWDWYHPTEAAVLVSANTLYDSISPLFTHQLVDVW